MYVPLYIFFTALLVFIIIYIVAFYIVRYYIVHKINPLYKIIHSSSDSLYKKAFSEINDDYNIISETQSKVIDWKNDDEKKISELVKKDKFRKEYIGNVSHELKTPLFTIQGYIATLLEGALYDKQVNTKYLEYAEMSVQRMITIVEDLDEISRLESGQIKPQISHFNCVDLIQEVFENQKFLAQKKQVSMIIKHLFNKKVMVCADRAYMYTVFSNLIVNAIMYNRKKDAEVCVSIYDMDSKVLVEVADTGIGIPKKDLHRVFERFYRVDKGRSRKEGGSGLGLAIVKHILEAHNQKIFLSSTLHKGSSFTFTLNKFCE